MPAGRRRFAVGEAGQRLSIEATPDAGDLTSLSRVRVTRSTSARIAGPDLGLLLLQLHHPRVPAAEKRAQLGFLASELGHLLAQTAWMVGDAVTSPMPRGRLTSHGARAPDAAWPVLGQIGPGAERARD